MSENNGGPAFPCEQHETNDGAWNQTFEPGMTLRDYFAAKAMQALIAKLPMHDAEKEIGVPSSYDDVEQLRLDVAASAFEYADAMLQERK